MILNKDTRHTDEELLSYSTSLFQVALYAHAASTEMTKRSLFFLYLYGWRYISRRQIYNLLSYDRSSEQSSKNAEEFIGKFIRADLIKKCNIDKSDADNNVYTLTKKGIDTGREYYIAEVNRIYNTRSVFYSRYIDKLLLGERANLTEYVQMFESYSTERYKNRLRSTTHRLSTMDSYIAFLRHLQPASVAWYGTEVKFYRGEVCRNDSSLISSTSDVRSDAMFYLALRRSGQVTAATGTDSQLVCIEQDTSHQTSSVLQDKIERYVNLIALPRYERYAIPPTLIFTVIPANRPGKKRTGTGARSCDQAYVEDLMRFAILYCNHIGIEPERVVLSDFVDGFESFCGNSPLFRRHLKFLQEHVEEYGKYLPLSKLDTRYRELLAQDDSDNTYRKKLSASYHKRRSTIFSAAAQVPGMELVARTGFSVCSTSNYEPSALLSLFPELSRGRDLLSLVLQTDAPDASTKGTAAEFIPFYKYRCHNGTEITFRNVYRIGKELYVMENTSEDYCGLLRLKALLDNEPIPQIHFLAVFPLDEYVERTKELSALANDRQRVLLYGCAYRSESDGNISYVNPIRISKLSI